MTGIDSSKGLAPAEDAWIEGLLREDAARHGHIPDEGFSERVMAALPGPRRRSFGWVVPAMAVTGAAVAVALMPGTDEIARQLAAATRWRDLGASQLLALVPVALLYWVAIAGAWEER